MAKDQKENGNDQGANARFRCEEQTSAPPSDSMTKLNEAAESNEDRENDISGEGETGSPRQSGRSHRDPIQSIESTSAA